MDKLAGQLVESVLADPTFQDELDSAVVDDSDLGDLTDLLAVEDVVDPKTASS